MRRPDALIDYLESRDGWAFGYGRQPRTHDCARFCGGGVKAVTGIDPLAALGARWTTAQGAERVLRRLGGMAAAVDRVMTRVELTLARRGDVGLTEGNALVLIEGDTVVGLAECGLYRLPRAALLAVWTID